MSRSPADLGFDDRRGSPDGPSAAVRVGLTFKPPVLRRGTITIIAIGGILAIVYGTLVPFNFDLDRPIDGSLPLLAPTGGDGLANVLVYVPMGIFLRLLIRRRGTTWLGECGLALLLACGTSYIAEVLQALLPSRVPSLTDTICNGCGAMIGIALAPAFQRRLRTFHARLYVLMRVRPFAAAAACATLFIGVYALAPFDLRPAPGHVMGGLARLQASWQGGVEMGYDLPMAQVLDKWAAAGTYGLLAFLLVFAGRETDWPHGRCLWHAWSRSIAMVVAIEGLQLFTGSHVADWRDIELAMLFVTIGCAAGLVLLRLRPLAYRDPAGWSNTAWPLVAAVVGGWVLVATLQSVSGSQAAGAAGWLPVMGSFNRSWDALVASYVAGLINYGLLAGLFVLWCRGRQRVPGWLGCTATPVLTAVLLQVLLAAFASTVLDTGHLLIAAAAGLAVFRIDRAVSGRPLVLQPSVEAGVDG